MIKHLTNTLNYMKSMAKRTDTLSVVIAEESEPEQLHLCANLL